MLSCFFSILISASLFATLSVSSLTSASFLLKAFSFLLSSNSVSISIVSCSAKLSTNRHQCFIAIRCGDWRSINAFCEMNAAVYAQAEGCSTHCTRTAQGRRRCAHSVHHHDAPPAAGALRVHLQRLEHPHNAPEPAEYEQRDGLAEPEVRAEHDL